MRLLLASLILASSLTPAAAFAFCRTTTDETPTKFDPETTCALTGVPIIWKDRTIEYKFEKKASRQISLAAAQAAMAEAFAKWTSASCTGAGQLAHPELTLTLIPAVDSAADDCGLIKCAPTVRDPQRVIVFRDDAWDHADPGNTLALTTVSFGVESGEIFDADMEINTHDHQVSLASPTPSGFFDLRSILVHEAGHFIGFAHSGDTGAVMFERYVAGRNELTDDDIEAVCTVYAAKTTEESGCACDAVGSRGASNASFLGVIGVGLLALVRLRGRRSVTSSARR